MGKAGRWCAWAQVGVGVCGQVWRLDGRELVWMGVGGCGWTVVGVGGH